MQKVSIVYLLMLISTLHSTAQKPKNGQKKGHYVTPGNNPLEYFEEPDFQIQSRYHFFKQDSATARYAAMQYFSQRFPDATIDSTSYRGLYSFLKVHFHLPNSDSVALDLDWAARNDKMVFRFTHVQVFQKRKKKSIENYLLSTNEKKKEALIKGLASQLGQIIDHLDSSNVYQYPDLKFLHGYTLHSRWEQFPPDSVSEEKERFLRDSTGIEGYAIKEDLPLDSMSIPFVKSWLLSNLKKGDMVFCTYDPHHFYRFYDEHHTLVGHLEICFKCSEYKLQLFPLSYEKHSAFSYDKEALQFWTQVHIAGIKHLQQIVWDESSPMK